ncbi:MAG: hypothetical protein HZB53_20585 [Chloroflexi bacterium]|nr:hypothetical protein [Chloroflexota bacterium]
MGQLAQMQPEFAGRGARIVAVTLGKPSEVTLFGRRFSEQILCLADSQQNAYRAYRIGKLNLLRELTDPRAWKAYVRGAAAGHNTGLSDQDMLQMNASFLIGAGGVLLQAHYNRYAGDHPDWAGWLAGLPASRAQAV